MIFASKSKIWMAKDHTCFQDGSKARSHLDARFASMQKDFGRTLFIKKHNPAKLHLHTCCLLSYRLLTCTCTRSGVVTCFSLHTGFHLHLHKHLICESLLKTCAGNWSNHIRCNHRSASIFSKKNALPRQRWRLGPSLDPSWLRRGSWDRRLKNYIITRKMFDWALGVFKYTNSSWWQEQVVDHCVWNAWFRIFVGRYAMICHKCII